MIYACDVQHPSTGRHEVPPPANANAGRCNALSAAGKDLYDFGDVLLIIPRDNLSIYGTRLPYEIPGKGQIITQMSAYWFRELRNICPNHLISVNQACFPDRIKSAAKGFEGQAMLAWKTVPLPVRCVVRGYLAGDGWREYRETGEICGNRLPSGLAESQRLPAPLFAPTMKRHPDGPHENIDYDSLRALLGKALAEQLREKSLKLYFNAWKSARDQGVLIADTTFEFGLHDGELMLIDECLTPDTSRFWLLDRYRHGDPMPSMDKQMLVDFLESPGTPETAQLPDGMLSTLGEKYRQAYRLITGKRFNPTRETHRL